MRKIRINIRRQKTADNDAGRTDANSKANAIELVDKASEGNLEAFGELYSIYLDQIYRYVFYRVKDPMLAEDITEDAFIKAWKSVKSCKGKGKTFLSWLYRIAHNQIADHFRNSHREYVSVEEEESEEMSITSEVEAKLEWQEVAKVIATLPRNQEQVITLKFIEGLSNREIGVIMGKSEGAIRVLQMRALTTVRREIKDNA